MASVMDATETNLLNGDQSMATAAITPATIIAQPPVGGGGSFIGGLAPSPLINYDTGVTTGGSGSLGSEDDNSPSPDPGFDVYVPNHAADANFLNDGAFYGGRGTDQYTGYQGDGGNFAQVGGQYAESSALEACFVDNPSGRNAASAIGNEVAAGQTMLAMAQTVQALDALNSGGGIRQNAGGNVALGMADLAGRGAMIGALSALITFGAQDFMVGGGVAAVLNSALNLGQGAGANSLAAQGLAKVITSAATLESSSWTFGPLNADEQTAMNAIDRTMVGMGNAIAEVGNYATINGYNPLAAPIHAPFGSAAVYASSHGAAATASDFPALLSHP